MKELKEYIERNELNIGKIINEYSSFLYKVIKNNSYNLPDEDIEEIITDSFFVLWNNYKKMNLDDKISNYLVGVSKNILFNKLRKNRKQYINVNIEDYQNIINTKDDVENLFED